MTESTRVVTEESFAEAVRRGLGGTPKTLPSKYLYDEVGSQLFEAICFLPEYYLTRAETEILVDSAAEIASLLHPDRRLVEFGAGSAVKTRILIRAMMSDAHPLVYCPIDISEEAMRIAEANIRSAFPACSFKGIIGDWIGSLERMKASDPVQKVILFLGSSIGNMENDEAVDFLRKVNERMGPDDRLLVGTDLVKDPAVLVSAYDDAAGVTAAFDRNLLVRIVHELGGRFDPRTFRHEARWNADESRMEMHLVSTVDQTLRIEALDMEVPFQAGESIHTENSHKYTLPMFEDLVRAAGLQIERTFTDAKERFALHLIRRED